MQLTVLVNDTDFSDAAQHNATRIRKELTGRVSTAELSFIQPAGDNVYDLAQYDVSRYGVDVRELYEVKLRDENDVLQFGGYATRIAKRWESDRETELSVACTDYSLILDMAVVPEASFEAQSDKAILEYLLATYCPQLTYDIEEILTIPSLEIKDRSMRQVLEDLCQISGGEYFVSFEKEVRYFAPGSAAAAPFGLTTDPDSATVEFSLDDWVREFARPINRCIVLGGLLDGGVEIRAQYDDPVSQQLYGIRSYTIVDREITAAALAALKAQATVEANAYPTESGKATVYDGDGLDVGQLLPVQHEQFGVDGTYLIRSVDMSWPDRPDTAVYEIELGARRPDPVRLLEQIEARSRLATQRPTALPAPGSVTDESIGTGGLGSSSISSVNASSIVGTLTAGQIGTISASQITGTIAAGQIGSVNATAILGLIAAGQIGTVSAASITGSLNSTQIGSVAATTITGSITSGQIGSVSATSITGVIVSSQVVDGLIDSLSKIAAPLRSIPNLASAPSLPDANYPAGSFYRNSTSGVFFENVAGTWTATTESAAVTGKLEYFNLGTIKAGSIVGLIAAAQIGSVSASSITGTINASQINTVTAGQITGTLSASQISSVNASSITGGISASQISTVNATAIQGTIAVGQLAGGITADKITSVTVGSLTSGGGYMSSSLLPFGPSDNLIVNGGFEAGLSEWPALWQGDRQPNPWYLASGTHTGTASIAHNAGGTVDGSPSGPNDYNYAAIGSTEIDLIAGASYALEGWFFCSAATNGTVELYLDTYQSDGSTFVATLALSSLSFTTAAGAGWTKISATGTAASNAAIGRIRVVLRNHTSGSFWAADDILLVRQIAGSQVQPLAISAGHIASVNATAISGTITAGQIGSITASQITGTLNSSQIGSVSATTITGTITSGQIGSITATQITGSITGSQIGSLTITGSNIANSTITDVKIDTISASKITAGTISASVSLTSPTLIITSGTSTVNIDATNKVMVTDTGLTRKAQITAATIRVESTLNSNIFGQISGGACTASNSSGAQTQILGDGLYVNSVRVVRSQYSPRPILLADVIACLVYHGLSV